MTLVEQVASDPRPGDVVRLRDGRTVYRVVRYKVLVECRREKEAAEGGYGLDVALCHASWSDLVRLGSASVERPPATAAEYLDRRAIGDDP